jgi:hypothetical protein
MLPRDPVATTDDSANAKRDFFGPLTVYQTRLANELQEVNRITHTAVRDLLSLDQSTLESVGRRLENISAIRAEDPGEHDKLLKMRPEFGYLYNLFPEWKDTYAIMSTFIGYRKKPHVVIAADLMEAAARSVPAAAGTAFAFAFAFAGASSTANNAAAEYEDPSA